MRRHGNLFDRIVAEDNLSLAFVRARRGKSWQGAVQRVERHLEQNLGELRKSLVQKTFHTSAYRLKVIHEPKTRTIYRLPFYPDRLNESKFKNNSPRCLTVQFMKDETQNVIFTGSAVLINQLEKYAKEIPFLASIRKIERYYTLS